MKKILMTAAVIVAAITITACGKKNVDVSTLALELLNGGEYAERLNEVSTEVTEKRCGIDDELVEICAAFKGTSAVADEIIVIKTKDTKEVNEKLNAHWESQIESYKDYLPSEVPKLEEAILYVYNDVVIFCVSEDTDKARQIIFDYTTN